MNTWKTIVLCDIDHTVSAAAWRDKLITDPPDWDRYHAAGEKDLPIYEMVRMVRCLRRGRFFVHGLTARPEKWREQTRTWLFLNDCDFDGLLMRPDDNHDPSPVIKVEMVRQNFKKDNVAFVIEDRTDVADAFLREGYSVLQARIFSQIKEITAA